MAHDVRTEHADARPIAAIRTTTTRLQLGQSIVQTLDKIWPVLRTQSVRTGHNVVIYYGGDTRGLTIEVGVETFTDFKEHGEIRQASTPSGDVATAEHYGDYSAMAPAYAALEGWCTSHGRRATGVSWEVYGDWDDDPVKRRTDVYFLLEPLTSS